MKAWEDGMDHKGDKENRAHAARDFEKTIVHEFINKFVDHKK